MIPKGALISSLALLSGVHSKAVPLTHSSTQAATDLIDRGLAALGGEDAIKSLQGITYHSPNIYRSRSLMQSYELNRADVAVAISGSQNISFSFDSGNLTQRIDRKFTPSDYWVWASPRLDPFDFSLVVQGGDYGFACFVRGNNQIWLPPDLASGYTDSALAEYLVQHGETLSPKLLSKIKEGNSSNVEQVWVNGIEVPAVHDSGLDVTVVFDPSTNLPYIVRTEENHAVYGVCTNDLYLSDYKEVQGIQHPHQVQTVYNCTSQQLDAVLEDYIIESITVNPQFPDAFFEGIEEEESFFPKSPPKKVDGISHARITEFSSNMLWSGITNATVEALKAENPVPGLPTVHWLTLDDDDVGVKQLILEFDTELIVCDAPPQWTDKVIEWIALNLKKPVTHVFPTHHHRDHSGGIAQYVQAGAKMIVPEIAVELWSSIPNVTFLTFNETHPYVHSDNNTQAWFVWEDQATHAADWAYVMTTTKCPTNESPVVVFEADVWQAGRPANESDQVLMRQWLDQVSKDGLPQTAYVLPTHGLVSPLSELINVTAYPYPPKSIKDWKHGAALC